MYICININECVNKAPKHIVGQRFIMEVCKNSIIYDVFVKSTRINDHMTNYATYLYTVWFSVRILCKDIALYTLNRTYLHF